MPKTRLQTIILIALIAAFTLYFSAYTIRRHETLHSYTADLSLIDQAMWNTLHGRFMEATWGDHQQPRTAEHFEPILIPLAALFWLWDDVRILLIAQAFALAIGALPVFWLAKRELSNPDSPIASGYSLLFPALYLLAPPLQAAAVADFHADPFVVAPLLFAFWYATEKRWGWMWLWAIVMMLVKENMPTLVVLLGMFLITQSFKSKDSNPKAQTPNSRITHHASRHKIVTHGIALIIIGTVYFAIATFGIVAPLAKIYFATDAPIYLASRFSTNPLDWISLLRDPTRWRYLLGLLATSGGLALFAPQYLLLGLPIFIANTFSNFAGQFSGEQHYSAPLVAVLMIAAIYGAKNIIRHTSRITRHLPLTILIAATIIAAGYHTQMGWTPLSRRAETYAVTPHTQMLSRFTAQIPASAIVSASAAVNPHLAHRAVAYTFPTVKNADFILVDVTDVPGKHPNDVHSQLMSRLNSGEWQLLDAADGFILLKHAAVDAPQSLPDAFFSFARAKNPTPQYPLKLNFDNQIELIGYDILDDPFPRQTRARLYWRAVKSPLPTDLRLWIQFYDDDGSPLSDPILQPAIETVWYPPENWRTGESVIATTLPANFGDSFHLAVAVALGDSPAVRLPLSSDGDWATIASFRRTDWALQVLPPTLPLSALDNIDFEFEGGLHLTGLRLPSSPHPADAPLSIVLRWSAVETQLIDYTIFMHLIDSDGNVIAQNDAQPRWLFENPMTGWQTGQSVLDAHTFTAPLPAGKYQLRVGLYNWQTLKRLPLKSGEDSVIIGTITIE